MTGAENARFGFFAVAGCLGLLEEPVLRQLVESLGQQLLDADDAAWLGRRAEALEQLVGRLRQDTVVAAALAARRCRAAG